MRALVAIALMLLASTAVAQQLPAGSYQYRAIMTREARAAWGLDANVALFAAQTHQESSWRPDAVSWVGARGLAQFMPLTAEDMNAKYPQLGGLPMHSPVWSIRAQVLYNHELFSEIKPTAPSKFPLHLCDRYAMMLSSYNGGRGWLRRDRRLAASKGASPDRWWNDVELHTTRSAAARKENREYPRVIIHTRLPRYLKAGWPGENPCSPLLP